MASSLFYGSWHKKSSVIADYYNAPGEVLAEFLKSPEPQHDKKIAEVHRPHPSFGWSHAQKPAGTRYRSSGIGSSFEHVADARRICIRSFRPRGGDGGNDLP